MLVAIKSVKNFDPRGIPKEFAVKKSKIIKGSVQMFWQECKK